MRAARAVVTSAVVAALAAAAHTAGGGQLPSVPVLAALGALVLLTVMVLARWQLRLWTLLPVLAGLQAALHGALSFLAPGTASAVVNPAWTHAHGAAQAPFALVSSSPMLPGHEMAAMPVMSAAMPVMSAAMPAMLLAHAAATVVTALVLVGADDAARRTACWLRAILPLIVSPAVGPIAAVARVVVAEAPGFVLIARGLVASRPRRGPPLGLVTA